MDIILITRVKGVQGSVKLLYMFKVDHFRNTRVQGVEDMS